MCIYESFHVIHTAVAYFNIVLVKDFVKFTSFWKVFFNDMYEFSADVSGNIFAEWWIIPNYFPISVASLFNNVLQKTTPAADNCNCKNPENCPLSGNCRTKNIVYKADVTSKHESRVYIGLCETEFKTRYNNHKSSFSLESRKKFN